MSLRGFEPSFQALIKTLVIAAALYGVGQWAQRCDLAVLSVLSDFGRGHGVELERCWRGRSFSPTPIGCSGHAIAYSRKCVAALMTVENSKRTGRAAKTSSDPKWSGNSYCLQAPHSRSSICPWSWFMTFGKASSSVCSCRIWSWMWTSAYFTASLQCGSRHCLFYRTRALTCPRSSSSEICYAFEHSCTVRCSATRAAILPLRLEPWFCCLEEWSKSGRKWVSIAGCAPQ